MLLKYGKVHAGGFETILMPCSPAVPGREFRVLVNIGTNFLGDPGPQNRVPYTSRTTNSGYCTGKSEWPAYCRVAGFVHDHGKTSRSLAAHHRIQVQQPG